MSYWNLICDLMFLLKNHLVLIGSDFQKSKKGVYDMKNMRKKLAALLVFFVVTVTAMGSGIMAHAESGRIFSTHGECAVFSHDTEQVN